MKIRGCIVLRSFYETVKEKCIDKGDTLTLANTIEISRNYESQLDSMEAIRGAEGNVNAVGDAHRKRRHQRKPTSNRKQSNRNPSNRN